MELYEKLGIKRDLLAKIIDIISSCSSVEKALVFGSRARGDYKDTSDIDIAISGKDITSKELNIIEDNINMLNTALNFDIIYLEKTYKKELIENIKKDGVEIYANRQS